MLQVSPHEHDGFYFRVSQEVGCPQPPIMPLKPIFKPNNLKNVFDVDMNFQKNKKITLEIHLSWQSWGLQKCEEIKKKEITATTTNL